MYQIYKKKLRLTTPVEYISYDTFGSGCYFWNKLSNNVDTRSQVRFLMEFPVVLLHQYSVSGLLLYYVFGLCFLRIATTHIYQRRNIVHFGIWFKNTVWSENMDSMLHVLHNIAYNPYHTLICNARES